MNRLIEPTSLFLSSPITATHPPSFSFLVAFLIDYIVEHVTISQVIAISEYERISSSLSALHTGL